MVYIKFAQTLYLERIDKLENNMARMLTLMTFSPCESECGKSNKMVILFIWGLTTLWMDFKITNMLTSTKLLSRDVARWKKPHLGRYSIYTWTWNVKREREKSNKRFFIVCIPYRRERDVNVKREFMTCDRVTRAWKRSLHVAIFHVHAQHSRTRNKNKKSSFYARGNRETN